MIKRETFITRFKQVTGSDSIPKISEKLGFITDETVKSWRRKNGALPEYENLALICEKYPVTPDYLLGYSDTFTPINSDILKETGLSGKSIEVLKQMNQRSIADGQVCKEAALINEILEGLYGADKDMESLFTMIYDYTHPYDISSPTDRHAKYSAGMTRLIQGALMDNIQAWLHTHIKKKPKDKLQTFASIEEYERWYKEKQKNGRH